MWLVVKKLKGATVWLPNFVFSRKKKFIQVWNNLRVRDRLFIFDLFISNVSHIHIFFSGSRDCAVFANNSRIHIFFPPGFQAATRALIHHCSDSIYSNSPFLCFCFHNAHKQQSYTHILIAHLMISRFAWIRLLFGEGPWVSHPPEATHT